MNDPDSCNSESVGGLIFDVVPIDAAPYMTSRHVSLNG